jgi:putative MATE family efflux protein
MSADGAPKAKDAAAHPRFVRGPLLPHVLVMSGTGAIGLMALFLADLVNMVFLGLLGDHDIISAVGYAGPLMFLTTSVGIGLAVGATAVISPAVGARNLDRAIRLVGSALALSFLSTVALVIVLLPLISPIMTAIGASGRSHELATRYLWVLIPSLPILSLAMCASAVLRALGDATGSMRITLVSAVVAVALDPIFIFTLGMGLEGSAIATALARTAAAGVGWWAISARHRAWRFPAVATLLVDAPAIARVAIPAVLTNVATPFAHAFATGQIAQFGDAAVAASALWGRLNPVAFGAIFALTAAIGPIVGQNYGARAYDRVWDTITEALKANWIFCLVGWLALLVGTPFMLRTLGVGGDAARLVMVSVLWFSPAFGFLGMLFVANAVFNVLGAATYATAFNWGRATIGTIPFVWLGGHWFGAIGAFSGTVLGAIPAGLIAVWVAYRRVGVVAAKEPAAQRTV